MYLHLDAERFASRGGEVGSDDDFVVHALTCCGAHGLYNEETLVFYPKPDDPSEHHLLIEGNDTPACHGCGSTTWGFADRELTAEEIQAGPWGWVLST